jgi:hypothetical protein
MIAQRIEGLEDQLHLFGASQLTFESKARIDGW